MGSEHGSPLSIMALLERFLPFAVSVFSERRELFDLPGYEPGLRESNLATILAHVAASSDYPEQAHGSEVEREGLFNLAGEALGRVTPHPWDSVPPLAWSYIFYALVLLGDRLDPSIRDALREGVRRWADRLMDYDFPTGLYRDTKAEETCWTAGPLVGALALWPEGLHRNAWQEKAAAHSQGPALVLAGPGAGKTRTLARRVDTLVRTGGVDARHILVLTFSNRAVREVRERIESSGVTASTFHSFARSVISTGSAAFSVVDASDRQEILRNALDLAATEARAVAKAITGHPNMDT